MNQDVSPRQPVAHDLRPAQGVKSIAEIAALYYQQNVTQQELSDRYHASRATIGRLLRLARESGTVTVRVRQHPDVVAALESEFRTRFGISHLLISIDSADTEIRRAAVGATVADWLCERLVDGMTVAVGMGRNVASVVEQLVSPPRRAVSFVAAMGGSSGEQETNADAISRRFATAFGGESETLYVPARVVSPALRAALLENDTVRHTLGHARRADFALIGIGGFGIDSGIVRLGWISPDECAIASAEGTVGEINYEDLFDIYGHPTGMSLRGRTVGLDLADFLRIPGVIAVVSEPEKATSVLGALRIGFISTLATSTATALAILDLDDRTASP